MPWNPFFWMAGAAVRTLTPLCIGNQNQGLTPQGTLQDGYFQCAHGEERR